jgi:hypothetical protein
MMSQTCTKSTILRLLLTRTLSKVRALFLYQVREGIEQGDGRGQMCMRASQPLLIGEGCLTGHGHDCPVSKAPPLTCGRDILDQLLIPETSLVPTFTNLGTEAQLAQSIEKFHKGAHQRLERLRVVASPHGGTVLCIGRAIPTAEGRGGQRSV